MMTAKTKLNICSSYFLDFFLGKTITSFKKFRVLKKIKQKRNTEEAKINSKRIF